MEKYLTTAEVATMLQVHQETVLRWARAGQLAGAKLGKPGGDPHAGVDVDRPHHADVRDTPALGGDKAAEFQRITQDKIRLPRADILKQVGSHLRSQSQNEAPELGEDRRKALAEQRLAAGQFGQDVGGGIVVHAAGKDPATEPLDNGRKATRGGKGDLVPLRPEFERIGHDRMKVAVERLGRAEYTHGKSPQWGDGAGCLFVHCTPAGGLGNTIGSQGLSPGVLTFLVWDDRLPVCGQAGSAGRSPVGHRLHIWQDLGGWECGCDARIGRRS